MRDKLIHEYFGTNLEIVWRVVERDLRRFAARSIDSSPRTAGR